MCARVFFFYVTDTHPLHLALWESGLSTPSLRLFRDYCLTMRIKREINVHSAKCDHMFLQLADYRANKTTECRTYFKVSSDTYFRRKRKDHDNIICYLYHWTHTYTIFQVFNYRNIKSILCILTIYVIAIYFYNIRDTFTYINWLYIIKRCLSSFTWIWNEAETT